MNVRAERFPLFDALRAIAALSVLVYHAGYYAFLRHPHSQVAQYTARLDVGVTIFFLISGFLLYRPFVRSRLQDEPMPRLTAYAWRRFLRIVPAYWVALTIVALWLSSTPRVFTPNGVPIYYGFAQIYYYGYGVGGIGQAWTLCVEVTFYAFLPLWALAMRAASRGDRRRRLITELVGLAVLFVVGSAYQWWALNQVDLTSLGSLPYLMPLPNFLDQFAVGMAVAVVSVWYEGRELSAPLRFVQRLPIACWAVAVIALWAASTQLGINAYLQHPYTRSMFVGRHELFTLIALAMLLPAVFAVPGRGLVGRVLASRPLRYMGLISYGFYLYHLAVMRQLQSWLGRWGDFGQRFAVFLAVGLVAAAVLATISYYVVERPALRLKRLVAPVREGERGEAIAEPAPASPSTLPRGA
jgi:peptidoglycan/LPS O-acetylase OafA/YrhL